MRLQQLFEYQFPEIKHRKVGKVPDQYHHGDKGVKGSGKNYQRGFVPGVMKRDKDVEHLGTRTFSSAYVHKDRPQDVRKISHLTHDVDGYFYYVKELAANPDNDNPYFPRFRDITFYEDAKGGIVYSTSVERLFDLSDLNRLEMQAISKRIFGDNLENIPRVNDDDRLDNMDVAYFVQTAIDEIRLHRYIIDDDFKRATSFIRKVANKYTLDVDAHHENVMFRRTPAGAQLVISDPLSFQRDGSAL